MKNIFIMPLSCKLVRIGFKNTSLRYLSTKQKLHTFYDVLNLKRGCTKKEIRNSFIKLSKLNHPDICGPSSNDKFVRINEAYNVLIDDNKKKLYDETLNNSNNQSIYYYQTKHQKSRSWKSVYNNPSNHWLSSNIAMAGFFFAIIFVGSIIRYYGVRKSTFIRNLLVEESDECLTFLEEQKLMKINKTNDDLINIFEKNIEKEYGLTIRK